MNRNAFLEYANAELRIIKHPYCESSDNINNVGLCVAIIDMVLNKASGPHEALAENFYQALGDYLSTPRYKKATLRAAIEKLATHFETFLRTAIRTIIPEKDVTLYNRESISRGKLSQSGYLPDFLKHLLGIELKLGESKPGYWKMRSVRESVYGICFRHQQRAKHEARNYTLSQLEDLASQILGAYLFFGEWLAQNSNLEEQVRKRQDFAQKDALLYWPEILSFQLESVHIHPEERELQEMKEN